MCLTVDSWIDINNIIAGSNNITKRKFNVKPYGYDKIYVDKDLIEDKLHQLIHQFNERKIDYRDFCSELLKNTYPLYHGNVRTCKILFYLQLGL